MERKFGEKTVKGAKLKQTRTRKKSKTFIYCWREGEKRRDGEPHFGEDTKFAENEKFRKDKRIGEHTQKKWNQLTMNTYIAKEYFFVELNYIIDREL